MVCAVQAWTSHVEAGTDLTCCDRMGTETNESDINTIDLFWTHAWGELEVGRFVATKVCKLSCLHML